MEHLRKKVNEKYVKNGPYFIAGFLSVEYNCHTKKRHVFFNE